MARNASSVRWIHRAREKYFLSSSVDGYQCSRDLSRNLVFTATGASSKSLYSMLYRLADRRDISKELFISR